MGDANICKLTRSNSRVSPDATEDNDICDISELQAVFDGAANTAVSRVCSHLFLCGSTTLANSELSLETQNIFLTPGAEFTMLAPPKGSNGSEVGVEDEQGEDGGDGGDGTDGTPGHDGGKGGNGGNGGNAGEFILDSDLIITGTVHKHGGKGGQGGPGGARGTGSIKGIGGQPGRFGLKGLGGAGGKPGYGMEQRRELHAREHWHDSAHCHGFGGLSCDEHRTDDPCGNFEEGPHGDLYKHCEGRDSVRGADGDDGKPGVKGKDGKAGAPGNEGLPGDPGNPGDSIVYQF